MPAHPHDARPRRPPLVRRLALAAAVLAAAAVVLVVLNGREPYAALPEP